MKIIYLLEDGIYEVETDGINTCWKKISEEIKEVEVKNAREKQT